MYPGENAWYFASVPVELSKQIKQLFGGMRRGFGSLRVTVTIGETTWYTSIFPDSKTGKYMLPLKSEVRKKENLKPGDTCQVQIEIET